MITGTPDPNSVVLVVVRRARAPAVLQGSRNRVYDAEGLTCTTLTGINVIRACVHVRYFGGLYVG